MTLQTPPADESTQPGYGAADTPAMLPMLYLLEAGVVRVLLACPSCGRTVSARWPAVRVFDCAVCGHKARVDLPPPAAA